VIKKLSLAFLFSDANFPYNKDLIRKVFQSSLTFKCEVRYLGLAAAYVKIFFNSEDIACGKHSTYLTVASMAMKKSVKLDPT
jgi:hypothetical protein